jgi:hypothetical protein
VRAGLVLLLAWALAAATPAPQVVVRLKSAARVERAEVTLQDVADLSGPEKAVRALRGVVVAEGLRPGSTVRLQLGQVQKAVREAGFDPNVVAVTGAREVVVRRGEAEAVVRKGATVRVVAAVGAVRVSTAGLALEPGDVGDTVRVRVLATRKEVLARVVEPGLVAVAF